MAMYPLMTSGRDSHDGPEDRCGFTYDLSTLSERGVGGASCWRPTSRDEDRCVWHADAKNKPREDFEDAVADHPERLDGAIVQGIEIRGVDWFEDATLIGARFTEVDVQGVSFARADLRDALFENADVRNGDFAGVNVEGGSITSSDLRGVSFVDARFDQAVLSNVRVNRQTDFGEESVYERELDEADLDEERYLLTAQAAIWSYREIQDLYRENASPYDARRYYYKEKDMRRRVAWHNDSYLRAITAEGSRWVTGYGMNPWRVVGVALVVIVACAIAYPLTGGIQETVTQSVEPVREAAQATNATNLTETDPSTRRVTVTWSINRILASEPWALVTLFLRSLYFSVITFTTLGYGDIAPVGNWARAIAGFESLVGALLTALLVFVLSRRIS